MTCIVALYRIHKDEPELGGNAGNIRYTGSSMLDRPARAGASMRPATLFTIAAETIHVHDDHTQLVVNHVRPTRLGEEGNFCITEKVQTLALPLHRARKCHTKLIPERGLDYVYEDVWYYVSPEVQKLLELTVQPRIDGLNAALRVKDGECRDLQRSVDATERAMLAFSKLPWWRRAYIAVFKMGPV